MQAKVLILSSQTLHYTIQGTLTVLQKLVESGLENSPEQSKNQWKKTDQLKKLANEANIVQLSHHKGSSIFMVYSL